jgi:Neuraminidase (sialidase)
MASYYDDNFGHWEIESDEDVEFYHETQASNVEKRCEGCGRMVKIQPQYAYCNSCADKRERGEEIYAEDE